jgi:hypothetical protein
MRRVALIALLFAGCFETKPSLLRRLHGELDEVQTAESSEMPYRAQTPDVDALVGMKRKELGGELGLGECSVLADRGQRCLYRFSTDPSVQSAPPLVLQVDFDASEVCTAARWTELR